MLKYLAMVVLGVSSIAMAGEVDLAQRVLNLELSQFYPELENAQTKYVSTVGDAVRFEVQYTTSRCEDDGDDERLNCVDYICTDVAEVSKATSAVTFEPGTTASKCELVEGSQHTRSF